MVVLECPAPGCTYKTADLKEETSLQLLSLHALAHAQTPTSRGPKLTRPTIDIGVDLETWNAFVRRWDTFRIGSNISESASAVQLFQCASDALGDMLLKSDPALTTKSTAEVIVAMKQLAVIPVAVGVSRAELLQMKQSCDEPVRTYAARVRGKAETCSFVTSTSCVCGKSVSCDYTEEVIRDVILAGLADLDIRREALSTTDILQKKINDVISIIESREMARNATPTSSMAAMSSYRQAQHPKAPAPTKPKSSTPYHPTPSPSPQPAVPCPECKKPFLRFRERPGGGTNRTPYKTCLECWRANKRQRSREAETPDLANAALSDEAAVIQLAALGGHDNRHPRVDIQMEVEGARRPPVPVLAVADTGAMTNVWGLREFEAAGLPKHLIRPTRTNIKAANGQPIDIVGVINCKIRGVSPQGSEVTVNCIVYVGKCIQSLYLSKETMIKLGIINKNFPIIGNFLHDSQANEQVNKKPAIDEFNCCDSEFLREINLGCEPHEETQCKCPQRTAVPPRPKSLPFPPTPENVPRMKQWLLEQFKGSTFNTCPHRALPSMAGPPMEIHIQEGAKPKVCNTPATVPLHWQQRVHDDLIRDEALGVIERVPAGVPVTWCHRMVVTRKHDGTPRRTVDLSPLNKFCTRETFPAEAPFHLARRVPGHTWKSVTDAWNGYHSVPLRESDRHLTTFITPFGKWRYTRAPQGFLSSGDGYNKRFDGVISEYVRKERCIDDTIHYDEDIQEHWWRTIDILRTMGAAGIVLNPDKFQFCQKQVDFAGFRISELSIEPLPKYIDAILSFPTPKSIKDIRSWFGLVNQVANYAQLREFLALFRPFLSPKYKFFWSEVLDKAFEESKTHIVEAIRTGVEIYDMSKLTCLRPDWSTSGIGYFLLQKHCKCLSDIPDCCTDGWKITLAGSRFLSGAEQRYAAVEGEALAIAWGLEQTKYFTQGCQNLKVVTDHKPLVKIFGDRTLDEIPNSRLFRLKQRTLPWHFDVVHMAGKTNHAADAASRYPAPCSEMASLSIGDCSERMLNAAISQDLSDTISVSWKKLAEETEKDKLLSKLKVAISENFPNSGAEISEYSRYRDSLYITDNVILYQDRVVVPPSLRAAVLDTLHAAHQGVSAMQARAQAIVFWPGMSLDIQARRDRCRECNRNAPSQAHIPSEPAEPPLTPFEKIYADFFEYGGHHYLAVGCRLAGWPEIFQTPSGSAWSGARGLIRCLRVMFSTFGAPVEISSDGGPEFSASLTKEFLETWDVKHRISSAYFPQSNGRAEVAVKAAKRLLRANTGPSGSIDNDKFIRAMMQLRNTPDPDCNLSPAQIIFGRPIRDSLSFVNHLEKYSNENIRPIWREAWASKEKALRVRFAKSTEALNEHSRPLPKLNIGDKCFVQNQSGNHPTKWDRTGTVVETGDHEQYMVKIDGSGRITRRNRQFLRSFKPASMVIEKAPTGQSWEPTCGGETEPSAGDQTQHPAPPSPPPLIRPDHDVVNPAEPYPWNEGDTNMQASEPPIVNDQDPPRAPKIARALKRLLPHNAEGLTEGIIPQADGGRRSRRHHVDHRGVEEI